MRLKLTLRRPGVPEVDLSATVDSTATVGDLAKALACRDPRPSSSATDGPVTIAEVTRTGDVVLDPGLTVVDAGLRSGVSVTVTSAEGRWTSDRARPAVAAMRVLNGTQAGQEFPLASGTSYIGRDRSCEVHLDDPLVSRQHAKIHVGETIEIVDLGSANGIAVGGGTVARAVVRPGDVVEIGDTLASIAMLPSAVTASATASRIEFNRSPRVGSAYPGVQLDAPEPPEQPRRQRFPMIPLLAPLVMGALLYLMTKSLTSLVFIGLSPLLMVGNSLESRIGAKKDFREAEENFHAELADLVTRSEAAAAEERVRRSMEHPSVGECVSAVRRLDALLWTRRPEHAAFLELRLGLGPRTARNRIVLPTSRRGVPRLWHELTEVTERFATIGDVPVVASLTEAGAIGVAGPRDVAVGVARSLVLQLVALHSPAEMVLTGCASTSTSAQWEWLKWLPHTSSPHSPISRDHLVSSAGPGNALLSELEDLVAERGEHRQENHQRALPVVVVLVDDPPVERSRLVDLAERGIDVGVHLLWVASATSALPAVCRTFVEVASGSGDATGGAGFVRSGETVTPLALDVLDAATVEELGRWLAPVEDAGVPIQDDSDLPRSVPLLTLVGRELADSEQAVVERWMESRSLLSGPFASAGPAKQGSLRATIGATSEGPHVIDLRSHGPHALVGGTTGSGKSELLQSWICSLAAAHSPQRVTFLLVDYKGGSAFSECLHLPHTVGLVTDLSPHLVRRTLVSLNAELRYREHVLAAKRAKDLLDLEKKGDQDAPPSLVIVVDEFAALVQEVPEFVDGVVNVAQRGRSLGLHLVLATQRPAGVIKDNLRANTNLRVALRMADEADSTDVLGSTLAASFDPGIPGRALVKTGPGRLVPFQAAYVGGRTSAQPPAPEVTIEELVFGRGQEWEEPTSDSQAEEVGALDIERLVASVRRAAELAEVPPPRKPWLEELRRTYDLGSFAEVPTRRRDDQLVFGIQDDPDHQRQPVVTFYPDRDGNLAVYGTGGSGKSTLLRTLAIAAGFTIHGGPCDVYGLDFGARGLQMLERLPHVGSVIDGDDQERVGRLLRWLRALIDDRAARYSAVSAGTITEYRRLADAPDERRILLLVDGMATFRQGYEVGERSKLWDTFLGIATDGRPVGVHVLLSADRAAAVPAGLGSAVQRRVVLRLADENEYALLGLPTDVLTIESPQGRGLVDGGEIQVAVLGGSADVGVQAAAVERLAAAMLRVSPVRAQPIERLPEEVSLSQLPVEVGGSPVLGLESESLAPVGFPARGSFLVAGPPGSGRTTALLTLVQSLRRCRPGTRLYYFGSNRSPLAGWDSWEASATTPDAVEELVRKLVDELSTGSVALNSMGIVLESVGEFVNGTADLVLQDLIRAAIREEQLVIAEGETSTLGGSFPLLMLVKSSRTGIVLQPDQLDGTPLFRTAFPRTNRPDFPVGRGFIVQRGGVAVVQLAMPN